MSKTDIIDELFINNTHILFGDEYLFSKFNNLLLDHTGNFQFALKNKIARDESVRKDLISDYLSNQLKDFFSEFRESIVTGGGNISLDEIKHNISLKIKNIQPRFN
jgi:ABC-type uncharacterized transport system YnjBCD ATPase subunit